MTALTDPFALTHKKDIKNRAGEVVASVDYVGWSQVADRLDEAAPEWSFEVIQLGADWCWGRLTIDRRSFDNIGYAENAEADWKKEPLKDAVSDALKRCAALAGVARYLYDKDTPTSHRAGASSPARPALSPAAGSSPGSAAGDEPPWPGETPVEQAPIASLNPGKCPLHNLPWSEGKFGWYCKSRAEAHEEQNARGYCVQKPTKAWIARQEVA